MTKWEKIKQNVQKWANGKIKNSKNAYLHLGHYVELIAVDNLYNIYLQVITLFMAVMI